MRAPQRKDTYFSELHGDEQRAADEWLERFIRLVLRIRYAYRQRQSYPQDALDGSGGTGTVRTSTGATPFTTK